jgi:hypothetical protein
MAVKANKKRRVVDDEDDEPEEKSFSNGKINVVRTIKAKDAPAGRAPGARNPEYEKLVLRLIRLAERKEGVVIAVENKNQKVNIREGVRKPLRVRGYDLHAATDYDDELGETLVLYATKKSEEDPEEAEEEEEVDMSEVLDRKSRKKRKVKRVVEEEEDEDED